MKLAEAMLNFAPRGKPGQGDLVDRGSKLNNFLRQFEGAKEVIEYEAATTYAAVREVHSLKNF